MIAKKYYYEEKKVLHNFLWQLKCGDRPSYVTTT